MSDANLTTYGLETDEAVPDRELDEVSRVTVPQLQEISREDIIAKLNENIDPLAEDQNYGISVLLSAL